MINLFNEKIILPLNDIIQGFSISRNLDFLMSSQWWEKEQFISFQEERLKQLISHIYEYVPFYNEWFKKHDLKPEDVSQINDLKKLPVISKTDISKSPRLFKSTNLDAHNSIRMYSSGSTGEPFELFISREAFSMKYAAALRGWYWMGYRLGDHYAKLSQNKRSSKIKKLQDFMNNCSYIYIPDLSKSSLQDVIYSLEKLKPKFVRCYPDPLMFIAKILKTKNKYLQGVKAINSTGNILTKESRALIEERFNCPVFDSYSCEGGALFYEGPNRENYLGSSEYAITEIINIEGDEVKPGEIGMHVTTDLWNYAMPLIRYNTQDLVVKSATESSCGRQMTGLEIIIGRDNDILITPAGNLLIVHLFTIYFEYYNSIKQFQIEQLQQDEFIFRLVVSESFTSEIMKEIHDYWQNFLGYNVKLSIEIHNSIPTLYSGKRRFLIRNSEVKLPY